MFWLAVFTVRRNGFSFTDTWCQETWYQCNWSLRGA